MLTREDIRDFLRGGTRQSLGRADEVAQLIASEPESFGELLHLLWDSDPIVRMRAADAAEKITVEDPALLQPHKRELLCLLEEAVQQELRWHLALMIPRLRLDKTEVARAAAALREYLSDRSSIVKTLALQGLTDLSLQDASLRPEVVERLRFSARTGTPAMRARSRKLLAKIDPDT